MTRVRSLSVAAAALAAAVICSATASGASAPAPRDELRSMVCQKALDPPARAVSIQAVMRPVSGTAGMQMRFDLMRRTKPGAPFRLVRGRLLGSWISPQDPSLGQRPGDVWIVNHPVVDLTAPATYRFRVRFRWSGSSGQTLSTADQTSSTCYQPELRSDLVVRSLTVTPMASGNDAYVAEIGNRGLTPAGPVEVDLAGVSSAPLAQTLGSVGARSSARERFVAPPCTAGASLTVTVDPSQTTDEYDFTNNTLTVPCPSPSASG
jgi:CARDB